MRHLIEQHHTKMNNAQIAIVAGILIAQKPETKKVEKEYQSPEDRAEELETLLLSV